MNNRKSGIRTSSASGFEIYISDSSNRVLGRTARKGKQNNELDKNLRNVLDLVCINSWNGVRAAALLALQVSSGIACLFICRRYYFLQKRALWATVERVLGNDHELVDE